MLLVGKGLPYYLVPLAMLMPWKCFMILYLRATPSVPYLTPLQMLVDILWPILAPVGLVLDSLAPGLQAAPPGVRRAVLVLSTSA